MQSVKELSLKSWPPGVPTEAQYPLGKVPLAEYLKMRAKEHPDKPAIIFYRFIPLPTRNLDEASNRVANYLLSRGVKKGDRVCSFPVELPTIPYRPLCSLESRSRHRAPCSPLFKEMELEYELNDAGVETLITLDVLYPVAQKVLANTPVKRVIVSNLNDFLPEEPTLPITDVMKIKKSVIPGTTDLMDILTNGDATPPDVKVDWMI